MFLIKIKNLILNILFPKSIEEIDIENMSEQYIFENIKEANEIKNENYKSLFQYRNKLMRKAIWSIKYNKNDIITKKFSKLLYDFIIENISDEMTFSNFNNPIIIPIPVHKNSLKERGYNQSEIIAKNIISFDNEKIFKIEPNALSKIKETPHQSKLKNKNDRLKNLKDCFYADEKIVKNKNIILIDDVITTGTTMLEATKTLKKAGAKKVIGFSIAH